MARGDGDGRGWVTVVDIVRFASWFVDMVDVVDGMGSSLVVLVAISRAVDIEISNV